MRILLATAVAIAPLLAAAGAQAEIVISSERTTPIRTSNATGTAADNVRIASGGSINLTSGAAVTLDSNNTVTVDAGGSISMLKSDDGATAILAQGGRTGGIKLDGAINITDTLETSELHKPFATGTDRYGVRVTGPGAFIGNVEVGTGGAIKVEGNNSYAMSIESALNGNLSMLGVLGVVGDNTYALRATGAIDGNVLLAGGITGTGLNARGASFEGDISGGVKLRSAIATTGYRFTTPPPARPTGWTSDDKNIYLEDLDPNDLLQGGAALTIAANVAKGVLLTVDYDDKGEPVAGQTAPSIASFGSAPAIQIGSETQAITLGVAGTGNDAYGFVNRGTVTGSGIYTGVNARALQLGTTSGQSVTVNGGVRNEGTITASAKDADATTIWIGSGVTTPTLVNTNTIQAGIVGSGDHTATAVQIGVGANLPSFTNTGAISSAINGDKGTVYGVRDLSGSLNEFTNKGSLVVGFVTDADNSTAGNRHATAIDLSANTTGVTLRQVAPDQPADTKEEDKKFASIIGDIKLGDGDDLVSIENGTVVGDIAFGAGADRLNILGGATVSGAVTASDGQLDINIAKGTLNATQKTASSISNLNVGADGTLVVMLDPAANQTGGFKVSGNATLADGAQLGVRFNSLLAGPTKFAIIEAGTLNVGNINKDQLTANSPYLYVVTPDIDVAGGKLYVDARRRTAAEADLIPVEASAFDAVYGALGSNEALKNLFLSRTSRDSFMDVYQQMLPDHSGGPLMSLSAGVDAVTRALTGRNATAAPGETSAWVQEINFYADKDKTDSYGFRSEGFGIAGGVEKGTNLGAFGLSAAFTSSDIKEPESKAEEVLSANLLELGLYWRAQGQYWTTWARAAGGYASFNAKRSLVAEGLYLNNKSDWHGWTAAAAGGASYERNFGRLNVRPEVYAEYFRLSENARSEQGGGDGFDLDIDSRDSHIFSAVAAMNIGYGFGQNGWLRPELRIGYRQNISVDAGETIARFASGGQSFTLNPDAIEGGGLILGFRVNFGNNLGMLSLTGDAELLEDYVRYSLLLRASFRF